jgi:hypothetical protein
MKTDDLHRALHDLLDEPMADAVLDDASEQVDAKVRRHRRRVGVAGAVMVVLLATAITVGIVASREPDKVGVVTTTPPKTAKLVPLHALDRIDVVVTLPPTAPIEDLWATEVVLQGSSAVAHYSRVSRPLSQRTGDGYSCETVPRWVVDLEPGETPLSIEHSLPAGRTDATSARVEWPALFASSPGPEADEIVPLVPFATDTRGTVEIYVSNHARRDDVNEIEANLEHDPDVDAVTRDPNDLDAASARITEMTKRLSLVEKELKLQIGPTLPPIVYTDANMPKLSIPPNASDDAVLLVYERNALYNHIAEASADYAELKVTGARPAPPDALLHRFRVTVAPAATAALAARYARMAGVAAVVTPAPVTCFTN